MDRGKPGSKIHVLSDAKGLPLLVGLRPRASMRTKPTAARTCVNGYAGGPEEVFDPDHGGAQVEADELAARILVVPGDTGPRQAFSLLSRTPSCRPGPARAVTAERTAIA